MIQRHILLLDSNTAARRNLAFLLHLAGYEVTEVAAAEEALNRLSLSDAANLADLLLVCEGDPVLRLPGIFSQLQQQKDRILMVTAAGTEVPGRRMPPLLPSCRRDEIIETLTRFWASPSNPHPFAKSPGAPLEY